MGCVSAGVSRRLRWGCLSLATVIALLAVASDPADARRYRRHQARSAASTYSPPYADIVIDAKTGAVLHESAPDAARHPASLTKIMTLYLLFERLEAGKITLDTEMNVSEEASSQAPTKLGLRPGDTLKVEDAIKGLVTKSANDAAVVIAEALGGSESEFAKMMTRKARAIGMRNTSYHNASGLPDEDQITTARDQAVLGLAIQERFPRYYRYFSVESFVYRGHAMRNHNRLLGKVEGVDGIKTGYTRSSGFNLITSVKRGGRHIVAVVLGGRSAGSRDARMRNLIDSNIVLASAKPKAPSVVADKPEPVAGPAAAKSQVAGDSPQLFLIPPVPPPFRTEATATIAPGSNAPITPLKVKTVTVKVVQPKAAAANPAATFPASAPVSQPETTQVVAAAAPIYRETPDTAVAPSEPAPSAFAAPPQAGVLGTLPAMLAAAKEATVPSAAAKEVTALPKTSILASAKMDEPAIATRATVRAGGWAIQVGAYEDEGEAKQHLGSARSKVSQILHKAEAYIERTVKGAKTYYRARFAGFDRDQAEAACKRLKRDDVACMATKL
jgi:D-alanyl-D-alanine carboxypeptidase